MSEQPEERCPFCGDPDVDHCHECGGYGCPGHGPVSVELPDDAEQKRAILAELVTHRREVLREAVSLVQLHVDLGAPPQRILTELRRLADA